MTITNKIEHSNGKKWGIMVYMAADNDLTQTSISAISGIRRAFENNKDRLGDFEFFLYFDGNAFGFPSLQFDFCEPESCDNPKKYNREFRTSPDSVYRFVEACSKKEGFREIQNYALIVSSHGYGFQEDTLMVDQGSKSSSTVQDLADNIGGLNKMFLGGRLKVLGFDSCVMNSVEVAFELSERLPERLGLEEPEEKHVALTDVYLVSSEGLVPDTGWNYSRIVEGMAKTTIGSSRDMAALFINSYIEEYKKNAEYSGISVDIAAVSLGSLTDLVKYIHQLGNQLADGLMSGERSGPLENAILKSHSRCQTYLWDQCVDIKDFCDQLYETMLNGDLITEDSPLQRTLNQVRESFNAENHISRSIGLESRFSNGVSLYFPWTYHSLLIILRNYRKLKFGASSNDVKALSGWSRFLWHYLKKTMRTAGDTGKVFGISDIFDSVEVNLFVGNKGHKINPPVEARINPPVESRMAALFIENFRRTHNVEWLSSVAVQKLESGLDANGNAIAVRRGDRRSRDRRVSEERRGVAASR
jgi:hypothetical protein